MEIRRIVKGLIVTTLLASMGVSTAFAATDIVTPGGTGSSEVSVTVAAASFSVTVPMQLPITVDGKGEVTTATDAKIINNSHGAVKVTGVEITPISEWQIVSYTKDMKKEKVGSKKLGFKINDSETQENGTISFNQASFPKLDGKNPTDTDELKLNYDAKLPAQKTEIIAGTKVANVVFTIGWDD